MQGQKRTSSARAWHDNSKLHLEMRKYHTFFSVEPNANLPCLLPYLARYIFFKFWQEKYYQRVNCDDGKMEISQFRIWFYKFNE